MGQIYCHKTSAPCLSFDFERALLLQRNVFCQLHFAWYHLQLRRERQHQIFAFALDTLNRHSFPAPQSCSTGALRSGQHPFPSINLQLWPFLPDPIPRNFPLQVGASFWSSLIQFMHFCDPLESITLLLPDGCESSLRQLLHFRIILRMKLALVTKQLPEPGEWPQFQPSISTSGTRSSRFHISWRALDVGWIAGGVAQEQSAHC